MHDLDTIKRLNKETVEQAASPDKGEATLTLPVTRTAHDPHALFFTEVWMSGTGAGGEEVTLNRTIRGGALVLTLKFPDGTVVKESIDVVPLVQAWANKIEEERNAR